MSGCVLQGSSSQYLVDQVEFSWKWWLLHTTVNEFHEGFHNILGRSHFRNCPVEGSLTGLLRILWHLSRSGVDTSIIQSFTIINTNITGTRPLCKMQKALNEYSITDLMKKLLTMAAHHPPFLRSNADSDFKINVVFSPTSFWVNQWSFYGIKNSGIYGPFLLGLHLFFRQYIWSLLTRAKSVFSPIVNFIFLCFCHFLSEF